jgi:hypothetical protein
MNFEAWNSKKNKRKKKEEAMSSEHILNYPLVVSIAILSTN